MLTPGLHNKWINDLKAPNILTTVQERVHPVLQKRGYSTVRHDDRPAYGDEGGVIIIIGKGGGLR